MHKNNIEVKAGLPGAESNLGGGKFVPSPAAYSNPRDKDRGEEIKVVCNEKR